MTEAVLPQLMVCGVIVRKIFAGGPATAQLTLMKTVSLAPPDEAVTISVPRKPTGVGTSTDAVPPDVSAVTAAAPLLAEKTTTVPSGTATPLLVTDAVTVTELPQVMLVDDAERTTLVAELALPGKTTIAPAAGTEQPLP